MEMVARQRRAGGGTQTINKERGQPEQNQADPTAAQTASHSGAWGTRRPGFVLELCGLRV